MRRPSRMEVQTEEGMGTDLLPGAALPKPVKRPALREGGGGARERGSLLSVLCSQCHRCGWLPSTTLPKPVNCPALRWGAGKGFSHTLALPKPVKRPALRGGGGGGDDGAKQRPSASREYV